jgi:thiamine-phosphate pyrophosphorylase
MAPTRGKLAVHRPFGSNGAAKLAEQGAEHWPGPDAEMTADRHARLQHASIYLIASLPYLGTTVGAEPGFSSSGAQIVVGWVDLIRRIAASGVGLVQLRVKQAQPNERRLWLRALRHALGPEVLLIVNDDLEAVFDASGQCLADGVHLGREDASRLSSGQASPAALAAGLSRARARLGPSLLLGTSTRSRAEVQTARAAGADHVGFGAMAATSTKPGASVAEPSELLAAHRQDPDFPIFPIGGLHLGNLHLVDQMRPRRAALGSALLEAQDPAAISTAALRWARGNVSTHPPERGAD